MGGAGGVAVGRAVGGGALLAGGGAKREQYNIKHVRNSEISGYASFI